MIITLETVRQILRETLGFESFTARFIERVMEDNNCETASISKKGTLTYNLEFVSEYASLSNELSNKLKKKNTAILTILFNGRNDCPEFEPFGEVIQLEDIT